MPLCLRFKLDSDQIGNVQNDNKVYGMVYLNRGDRMDQWPQLLIADDQTTPKYWTHRMFLYDILFFSFLWFFAISALCCN